MQMWQYKRNEVKCWWSCIVTNSEIKKVSIIIDNKPDHPIILIFATFNSPLMAPFNIWLKRAYHCGSITH